MNSSIEVCEQAPVHFDLETRKRNDLETFYAECLDGSMRTPFEYTYDPVADIIFAEDGSSMDDIFDDAYEYVSRQVEINPNLAFEKRRSALERGERDDMHAMLRGELPHVMVVVSDFPKELVEYPKDYAGYNVTRQQTMMRVIVQRGNCLKMYSQTLDGSNRTALESLYNYFDRTPEPGELLGQRIHVELDDKSIATLVDDLQAVYDSSLYEQTGRIYRAGIELDTSKLTENTYDFVRRQKDLVELAVQESLSGTYTDDKHYQTIAALQARFDSFSVLHKDQGTWAEPFVESQYYTAVQSVPMNAGELAMRRAFLLHEREAAGLVAAKEGRLFSACGSTSSSSVSVLEGDVMSGLEQLDSLGYSTAKTEEGTEDCDYDDTDFCAECQAPPGEGENKKRVGPCKICEDCVNSNHGGKQ